MGRSPAGIRSSCWERDCLSEEELDWHEVRQQGFKGRRSSQGMKRILVGEMDVGGREAEV